MTVKYWNGSSYVVPILRIWDGSQWANVGSAGTAQTGDVLEGETFSNDTDVNLTGTMPNNGNLGTYTPGTSNQSIPSGYTSGGTVAGDSNLTSGNIIDGVSIFGVTGTTPTGNMELVASDNEQHYFSLTEYTSDTRIKVHAPGTVRCIVSATGKTGSWSSIHLYKNGSEIVQDSGSEDFLSLYINEDVSVSPGDTLSAKKDEDCYGGEAWFKYDVTYVSYPSPISEVY